MKIKYIFVLLVLAILASECYTQRGGGGRSRSRSSWGGSSRSRGSGSGFFSSSTRSRRSSGLGLFNLFFDDDNAPNTTNATDGTNSTYTTDEYGNQTSNDVSSSVGMFLGAIGLLGIFGYVMTKDRNK